MSYTMADLDRHVDGWRAALDIIETTGDMERAIEQLTANPSQRTTTRAYLDNLSKLCVVGMATVAGRARARQGLSPENAVRTEELSSPVELSAVDRMVTGHVTRLAATPATAWRRPLGSLHRSVNEWLVPQSKTRPDVVAMRAAELIESILYALLTESRR